MENDLEVINNNENKTNEKIATKQYKKGLSKLLKVIGTIFVMCILLVSFLKLIFHIETADTKDDSTAKKWQAVAKTSSANISERGGTVIENAIECHKYLRENGFTYSSDYTKYIPDFLEASEKVVDCSTYANWVLYKSGLDSFKGPQETQFRTNPHELKRVSEDDIQPGDVLVYRDHVEFAAKVENKKVTLVYSGGSQGLDKKGTDEYPETCQPYNSPYTAILRVP